MKTTPTLEEFTNYGFERLRLIGEDPKNYTEWLTNKYFDWEAANWHTRPNDPKKTRAILNWKSTLGQCLRYREPNRLRNINVNEPKPVTASKAFMKQWEN